MIPLFWIYLENKLEELLEERLIIARRIKVSTKQPVIYFLLWKDEIVYIGETTNLMQRLGNHCIRIKFDSYSFIKADSNILKRRSLEEKYIREFKPRHNIKGVVQSSYKILDPMLLFHKINNHEGKIIHCLECRREARRRTEIRDNNCQAW